MSILAAMITAVSGLNAQSRAMGNISDNIANSQTIGYKKVATNFEALVTQSNAKLNAPGGVIATPLYANNVQGNLRQVESPTNLAVSGQGFFVVSRAASLNNNTVTFDATKLYTRAGGFALDKDGYLVNNSGYYLSGWSVPDSGPTPGVPDRSNILPIRVSQLLDNPIATSSVTFSGNLPANVADNTVLAGANTQVYDAVGNARSFTLQWTKFATNEWALNFVAPNGALAGPSANTLATSVVGSVATVTLGGVQGDKGDIYRVTIDYPSAAAPTTISYTTTGAEASMTAIAQGLATAVDAVLPVAYTVSAAAGGAFTITAPAAPVVSSTISNVGNFNVTFGSTPGIAGTVTSIVNHLGTSVGLPASQAAAALATVNLSLNYGYGAQSVAVKLGNFQQATGVTQFAGTDLEVTSLTQNGVPRGSFQDVTIRDNGDVVLNYDNGQRKVFFRVPLGQFYNPNALQKENGGAFSQTLGSGEARLSDAGEDGTGSLVSGALEESNVDIAEEFSKMIITQRGYSANSRIITTADEMLNELINIKR